MLAFTFIIIIRGMLMSIYSVYQPWFYYFLVPSPKVTDRVN